MQGKVVVHVVFQQPHAKKFLFYVFVLAGFCSILVQFFCFLRSTDYVLVIVRIMFW